MGLTMFL